MASWEGKKYKLDKSENFDEYMKALGELLCDFKNCAIRYGFFSG